MAKIIDFVQSYTPTPTTKLISDLKEVNVDMDLKDDEYSFKDKVTKEDKKIIQKVITVDGVDYRVPTTVIQQLKVLLTDNPNIKKFKVIRSGTTKDDTKYLVIPVN